LICCRPKTHELSRFRGCTPGLPTAYHRSFISWRRFIDCRVSLDTSIALPGGGLTLAGCSGWSYSPATRGNATSEPRNLGDGQAHAPTSPTNFTQGLAMEYSGFATSLASIPMTTQSGDWADADYFSRKRLKADGGETVLPENKGNWLVPLEYGYGFRTQLADGRKRLVGVLDAGARDRTPALSARAQVHYDCWVEQMERNWQLGSTGTCRSKFLAALDELEAGPKSRASVPPPPARAYDAFFDFDKSTLTAEGHRLVDAAASAVGSNGTVEIILGGQGRSFRHRSLQQKPLAAPRRQGCGTPSSPTA
jgi:hypothetical protein